MARITEEEFFGLNDIENENNQNIKIIDMKQIVPNENNFYEISELEGLVESIKNYGFIGAITVKKVGNHKYKIVSGERRFRACKMAGFDEIPAIVYDFLNDDEEEDMLIDMNKTQRERSDKEKRIEILQAKARIERKKMKGEYLPGKLKELIADETGNSPRTVQRVMTIHNKLIPELKTMLEDERFGTMSALEFAKLDSNSQKMVHEELRSIVDKSSTNPSPEEIKLVLLQAKEFVGKGNKDLVDAEIVSAINKLNISLQFFCNEILIPGKLNEESKRKINKVFLEEILRNI